MTGRDLEAPRHTAIAVAFLVFAVVLGGGGTPNPGAEVLLQLAFVAAALAWLWIPSRLAVVPMPRSKAFWAVSALVLILPLMQLIPLPHRWWTGLAGQESRAAALALVGREDSWQPLSQYPSRTLASLLALVPALFAFFAASSLEVRGRLWLVGTIGAMAVVAALFGAIQLSMGTGAPHLYTEISGAGVLTGFQANRNAAADLLLMGMVASAAWLAPSLAPRPAHPGDRPVPRPLMSRQAAGLVLSGILVLLFFATVLTKSRTGIALFPFVLLAIWLILRSSLADLGRVRFLPVLAALAIIVLVAVLALQGENPALKSVADRFAFTDDARRELWRDAWFMIDATWPFGVGMGGAQPALVAAERLEVLDPLVPNRVHNDYLELLLEGGLAAAVLFAAVVLLLAWQAWRTWQRRPEERHLTGAGLTILVIAAAHSFVDYPLRSMALACLVGTGAGLLLASPRWSTTAMAQDGPRAASEDVA